jgi:tetratricopeptide (TPR) repeat protein
MQAVFRTFPKLSRELLFILCAGVIVFLSHLFSEDTQLSTPQAVDFFTRGAGRDATSTEEQIEQFQSQLRANPGAWEVYSQLGLAYLQRARETGDPAYYLKAEKVLREALNAIPDDYASLVGMGMLALARHQFQEALEWGERARREVPDSPMAFGVIADAQVELGKYDEAAISLQAMVDIRPDLNAYSRISYLRELYGDLEGAVLMMQWAVDAGQPNQENAAWTRTQLGNLYFNRGDLETAEKQYALTLANHPGYVYALAGMGKVQAARGNFGAAIGYLEGASQAAPIPEFIISLIDVYQRAGNTGAAEKQIELLKAIQQLYEANGVDLDLEVALFNADHRIDLDDTLKNARQVYARRPSVFAADVLAWVLYTTGRCQEARAYAAEALNLGTRHALFFFHAGMIEHCLGNDDLAVRHLQQALEINPYFSLRYSQEARRTLEDLTARY